MAIQAVKPARRGIVKAAGLDRSVWQRQYVARLRLIDTIVVVIAVFTAQRVRFGVEGRELYWNVDIDYTVVSASVIGAWLIALSICRSRSARVIGAGVEEYRRVWTATWSVFGLIAITSMLLKLDIARGYLFIALPVGLVGLFVGRRSARWWVSRRRSNGEFLTAVLAVGEPHTLKELIRSLARHPAYGYAVTGVCIPGGTAGGFFDVPGVGELPVYGDGLDIASAVEASGADTVAVTGAEHWGPQGIRNLSWALEKMDVDLVVSPGVIDVAAPRVVMQPVEGLPLIHVEKPRYHGAKRFEKRLIDLCIAVTALLITAPALAVIAMAIKLTSPGPVFYTAERIGLEGRPFRMIKFRTMVVDADLQTAELLTQNDFAGGVLFKLRRDPRVTPVGRWLRKYSLDELPQFINVLKKEMSVVGPRPPLAREVAAYDDSVRRRLLVLPGITGLWQISGRSDLSWEDSVRLDLSYVDNWSMISDLLIVVKTVAALARGSGAY